MQKQSPCCARRIAKVRMDEANLVTIARRASKYPESPRWHVAIKEAKAKLAEAKQSVIDHEAEHAGAMV